MTCAQCGRAYTSGGGHCVGCHESFNSDSAFDAHRINFTCRSPDQMRERGMDVNRRGMWVKEPWRQ